VGIMSIFISLFVLGLYFLAGFIYAVKKTTDQVLEDGPKDREAAADAVAAQLNIGDDETVKWLFFWPAYLTVSLVKWLIYNLIYLFISLRKGEV
jgi:hypothetical protein